MGKNSPVTTKMETSSSLFYRGSQELWANARKQILVKTGGRISTHHKNCLVVESTTLVGGQLNYDEMVQWRIQRVFQF